ncbi:YdbL family protein [Pseudomonas aeruginosa]|nr:YdbL family protein [Pseudomonas aeruginosa]MBG5257972.1 YdbL family protein [Pseudomonas aeruginosa]MBG5395765.1 YdbL family protein [Pseudomonas aeruginosa]MBI8693633.1 YdbL family protein [Pseudomonas aeruginosa]
MTTRSKLGIALLALGISLSAMAMDLGQAMSALGGAKAQGLVGEQADGYLGVVSNSGQAADIAAQINAARRAEYQKVANSSGASLADVEAMAGKKAMERTPAGQYVQVGGKWVEK